MADESFNLKTWTMTMYPYLSEQDAELIADKAKMFYYDTVYAAYPDVDETSNPITSFRDITWLKAAVQDMAGRYAFGNVVSYSENGLSVEFASAQLSPDLIGMLTPIIGVIV